MRSQLETNCCTFLAVLVLLLQLVIHPTSTEAETSLTSANYISHACGNSTSFTENSVYESNLNDLLSTLSSNTSLVNGFYYATAGRHVSDLVFGLYLCRWDMVAAANGNNSVCHKCVADASLEIRKQCPSDKQAIVWYDKCILRYSDEPIFNVSDLNQGKFLPGGLGGKLTGTTISTAAELLRDSMVNSLALRAASSSSSNKFAAEEQNLTDSAAAVEEVLYGLAQCTPDLSAADCIKCLKRAIEEIPRCCNGQWSARLLLPSCFVMYGLDRFFNSVVLETPPPPVLPPPTGKTKRSSVVIVAITVVPVVVTALLLSTAYSFHRRRERKKYNNLITQDQSAVNDLSAIESLQFDFRSIETATSNFSHFNLLGKGGFGEVYKGMLLNGREIAVKRLSKSSGQGATEFKNEVILVAKLQHRNLARLLGFCLEGDEKILVYEYVPNKSLDYFLFDPVKRVQLNWSMRCSIIEGIARGILYLHEDSRLKIIHRDLKASNILLDKKFNPKVSDFGMAKMFGVDQTQGNTRRIVGTYGYMAPEYAMEGRYSVKSDVFSFGVLLLEILNGRRNSSFHITESALSLVAYAWQLWNESKALELMDPCLEDSCHAREFLRYVHIGLLCVQEDALLRPTMSSVVLMLKSEAQSLPQPERPAFIARRHTGNHKIISINSCSVNGMTVSDFLPR